MEKLCDYVTAVSKCGCAEKDPAERDEPKRNQRPKRIEPQRRLFLKFPAPHHAFDTEQRAMIAAPDDEVPACAVPQSSEQHRQHQISVGSEAAVAVSAQRNVQIIAQP